MTTRNIRKAGLINQLSILRTSNSEIETEDRLARYAEPLPPGQIGRLTKIYSDLLDAIGEDSSRQGLVRTPARAARALEFLTQGYRQSVEEIVNDAIFDSDASEIILVKDIELYSMCEHHLLPFFGKAHIAYVPNGKVIGLSKIPRLVDVFSRRLQVQERLTTQIGDAITDAIHPQGVAVILEAQHLCMMMRGVEKQHSSTVTSAMLGVFKTQLQTRNEFLSLVRRQGNSF